MTQSTEVKINLSAFDRRWLRRVLCAASLWFLICVLYTAPATLFVRLIQAALPALQLQNAAGSFWNGTATQAFWQDNNQAIALGKIEWHLQPWSLLWLHPSARVATSYGEQFIDASLRLSPLGTLVVTKTTAALPAALLSNWAPIPVRGQIALKLDRAELSRTKVRELHGALYWQHAQWQWNSHWLELGDYRCGLTMPTPQQIHCGVEGRGALALNGVVDIDAGARAWAVQLQIQAAPALPNDFRQGLQLMLAVKPDAQGNYAVKRKGHW